MCFLVGNVIVMGCVVWNMQPYRLAFTRAWSAFFLNERLAVVVCSWASWCYASFLCIVMHTGTQCEMRCWNGAQKLIKSIEGTSERLLKWWASVLPPSEDLSKQQHFLLIQFRCCQKCLWWFGNPLFKKKTKNKKNIHIMTICAIFHVLQLMPVLRSSSTILWVFSVLWKSPDL